MKKRLPLTMLVAMIATACLLTTELANAQGWYDANWQYRRVVTVANPGGTTLTDYQVRINLTSSFDFSRAKSNGGDVRLAAGDGTTLLPYWVESWDATGSQAIIWVKVPSVPAGGTTVYLYYGNPAATTTGSGDATFLLYDDFSGSYLDSYSHWRRVVVDNNINGSHNVEVDNVDGDGRPDIVACAYIAGVVVWYKNPTDPVNGVWTKYTIDPALPNAHDIKVGDIDGDGLKDVVGLSLSSNYGDYGAPPGYLSWYQKPVDPTGAWTKTIIQSSGDGGLLGSRSCELADLDRDGDSDIVVAVDRAPGKLFWYKNPGGSLALTPSNWTEYLIASGQGNGADVRVGDVDLDGNLDIVYSGTSGSLLYVYFGPADPTNLAGWVGVNVGGNAYNGVLVDFDGDGDLDILRASANSNLVSWIENPYPTNPRVGANWHEYIIENNASITVANRVWAADIDQDGDLDIGMDADPSTNAGVFKWYRRPLDPKNVGAYEIHVIDDNPAYTSYAHDSYPADIDMDGKIDVVGVGPMSKTVMWWVNDPSYIDPLAGINPNKWDNGGGSLTAETLTISGASVYTRSRATFQYKAFRSKARYATLVAGGYGDIGFHIGTDVAVGQNDAMFTSGWSGLNVRSIVSATPPGGLTWGPDYNVGTDWQTWDVLWKSNEVKFVVNDALWATHTNSPSLPFKVQFCNYTSSPSPTMKIDWALVRNYSSPEPTSTVNLEESPSPPSAPLATAATDVSTTGFTANWNASAGALSYRLDVATDGSFASILPSYSDLTVSGLSQGVTGLSSGTDYFYRVRAVNASGTSGNSNTIAVTTLANHTITATAGVHGSISPSGEVVVAYGADQSFAIAGDPGYHIADVVADGSSVGAVASHTFHNVTDDHTIHATFAINSYTLTVTPPVHGTVTLDPPGGTYDSNTVVGLTAIPDLGYHFVNWTGADVPGGHETDNPLSIPMNANKNVSVNFAITVYAMSTDAIAGWNLVSVPVQQPDMTPAAVFGDDYGTTPYYLFQYNGVTNYSLPSTLTTGRGYWLASNDPQVIDAEGIVASSVSRPLLNGFNIIGDPFPGSESKDSLRFTDGIVTLTMAEASGPPYEWLSNVLYKYADGGYGYETHALEVWKGYWIPVLADGIEVIHSPAGGGVAMPKASPAPAEATSAGHWNLDLSVSFTTTDGRICRDAIASFGVRSDATAGFESRYDAPRPPRGPGEEFVEISFLVNGESYPKEFGAAYARDYRAADKAEWEFVVNTSGEGMVTLNWDKSAIATLGSDIRIQLYDKTGHSLINMKKADRYTYEQAGTSRLFTVNKAGNELPSSFALMQNYPNPFNPTTAIIYALPLDARVLVEVYDFLGRKVATIVEGSKEAGYHELKFDASQLPSGLYVYRISAVGDNNVRFSGSKKMMLVK